MTAPSDLFDRLQASLGSHYRLERELGHGGMGVVFLARDTTLDRPVAVKVIHPDLAVHSSITQRFLAEARMIARLRHPSIVAVHTAGQTTGLFYYVMDYVPGESLRQRLTREGRLPAAEVARITADLADALHAAGQAGLVHRDVKPENILLDEATGRAMLADFGIARAMAADADGIRTGQGVAVGTPTYMSPEQAAGDSVDGRSDLYALGVVAYELLAGHAPFRAQTAAQVATMHLAEAPEPVESARPDAPPALAGAIMRALAKDPRERWQTGAEFRQAIFGQVPLAPPSRTRRRRRRTAALVAGFAGLALAIAFVMRPGGPPAGVNPRHSILVLPFENLRQDPAVEWLRDGSVNMLALNLSQWNDLSVVDHERLHDLLERRSVDGHTAVGLDMARRLARDAGMWTVVLGDFTKAGDSLQLVARVYDVASGQRLSVSQVAGRPGDDVRPLFDRLAAELLDLSGAPSGVRASLAQSTTQSLEAFRAYLQGLEDLNSWNLRSAENQLREALRLDSTFSLAYYKLALTRGWEAGPADTIGMEMIRQATRYAARLPDHDQRMIEAYRLFLEGQHARSAAAYVALLARDSTDADAWYGLGDVTYHDPDQTNAATRHTRSLRAFKRALALDPGYYLAYEHVAQIYRSAAQEHPPIALLPNDSVIATHKGGPGPGLDSLRLAQAIQRARAEGIASAREWRTRQPANAYAQNALILALTAAHQFDAALAEVDRLAGSPEGAGRFDLGFLRAQVLAQQGDLAEAAQAVTRALDSASPSRFEGDRLPFETLGEVANGANVLAYEGKVELASRTLDLAAEVSARWFPQAIGSGRLGDRSLYGHLLQGHLYTALGAPADTKLRPIWNQVADSARKAPRTLRGKVAEFGWPAAVGLYLQNTADPAPLNELAALGAGAPAPELRALAALEKGDSAEARRLLSAPDSATEKPYGGRPQWGGYREMIAAHAWMELGDDQRALRALDEFEPARLSTSNLDIRWLLLGQARVLRGEILERQGRRTEARDQYRLALAQWADADPVLEDLVTRVRARLNRLEGRG